MRILARFLLLGALLFALDRGLSRRAGAALPHPSTATSLQALEATPDGDVRLLATAARRSGLDRFDPVVRARLVRNLRFLGRDGSSEALYREALALGMDRSDLVIERRLADRMAARIRSEGLGEPPSEAVLRRWYAQHRARWERAPAVSFTHVFVSRQRHGIETEARARAVSTALRAQAVGPEAAPARGDPFALGARVPLRRAPDLASAFGAGFAAAVLAVEPGAWSEPIPSSYGLHLVWVHERRAGGLAPFEAVRPQVEDAWREARGDAALRVELARLRVASEYEP